MTPPTSPEFSSPCPAKQPLQLLPRWLGLGGTYLQGEGPGRGRWGDGRVARVEDLPKRVGLSNWWGERFQSQFCSMGTYYKLGKQKKFSGWLTQWFFSILVWCHEVEQEIEESGFFSFPEKELRDSVKSIFETPRCDFCMVEITSKEKIESVEFCLFSISKVVPKGEHLWNNTMNLYPNRTSNKFLSEMAAFDAIWGGSISSGGIRF